MHYKQAAKLINQADALLITAGAGMGVDSGLPDFRGKQGFWKAYPAYAEKGLGFTDMANPSWFYSDPEFAWGFYGHRLNLYKQTKPHIGFDILLKWGNRLSDKYFVFTSNVDGQFQKAGFSNNRIIEIHGSIHYMQCSANCSQKVFNSSKYKIEVDHYTMKAISPLPLCPKCNALARPNILMFGDWEWDSSRQTIQSNNYMDWLSGLHEKKVVIIECGAGTAIPSVRSQSEQIAGRLGNCIIIRVNIRDPYIYKPNLSFAEGAKETIVKIDELISD